MGYMLDENEFLVPHSISLALALTWKHPFVFHAGGQEHRGTGRAALARPLQRELADSRGDR